MKDYYDMRNKIVHTGATYKKEDAIEFKEIVADIIRLITFGMKNKSYSDFSKEFNMYNIINKKIDINEIKNKYKKVTHEFQIKQKLKTLMVFLQTTLLIEKKFPLRSRTNNMDYCK